MLQVVQNTCNGELRSCNQNFTLRCLQANSYRHLNKWSQGKHPRGTQDMKEGDFFLPIYYMFGFTSQVAIATFSAPPCHGRHLNSEVLQNCIGLPWRTHKRLRSCWREGHILDASSSSIYTRLHPRVKASHTALFAWALSTATACSGVHFRTARHVRKEELVGHLGDSLLTKELCLWCVALVVQAALLRHSEQVEEFRRKMPDLGFLSNSSLLLWMLPVSSYLVNTFVIMTNGLPEEKEKDI